MLSASEFTVGTIGAATPLTLVVPRNTHEEVILIGRCSSGPAAIFLGQSHQFQWFESTGNEHWCGLLIPSVRIEVDVTSVFDPSHLHPRLGTVVRKGTQLVAQARASSIQSLSESIVLEDNLSPASADGAGFLRWQVVLGSGREKRVLHDISIKGA